MTPNPTSADVAARRTTTDSSIPNASHSDTYTNVTSTHARVARPLAGRHDPQPDAARSRRSAATTETRTSPMTASPAANLPLMTSSRWIGWDSSRGSVPSDRSPLMASNAKARPEQRRDDRRGTRRPTAGSRYPAGPSQNSARNIAGAPVAAWAPPRGSRSAAKYSGMAAARPRTTSSTMNRTASRWSPNSLAATIRQPARQAPGADRSRPRSRSRASVGRRARRDRWRGHAGRSVSPALAAPRPIAVSAVPRRSRAPCDRCPRATARPAGATSAAGRCSSGGARGSPERTLASSEAGRDRQAPRVGPAARAGVTAATPGRPPRTPLRPLPVGAVASRSRPTSIAAPSVAEQAGRAGSSSPRPTIRPEAKMPIRSQTDWTWLSRWLESRIASPRSWTRRAQQVEDLDDAERVDRRRRLVEDEDVGVLHERVGDAEPLLHAARVRLDAVVGAVGQADLVEDLVDASSRPRRRRARSAEPCSAGSGDRSCPP